MVRAFTAQSNVPELDSKTGQFECVEPSTGNHGPMHIDDTFYFRYADGTPYRQFGTTCYAWTHQGEEMERKTLQTLANSPFNKIRLCIFPKDYVYNKNEPVYYPYEGTPLKNWDFTRFNPPFWRHFEQRVLDLQKLGIEADVVLLRRFLIKGVVIKEDLGRVNFLLRVSGSIGCLSQCVVVAG